jgi:hypothetical protein
LTPLTPPYAHAVLPCEREGPGDCESVLSQDDDPENLEDAVDYWETEEQERQNKARIGEQAEAEGKAARFVQQHSTFRKCEFELLSKYSKTTALIRAILATFLIMQRTCLPVILENLASFDLCTNPSTDVNFTTK